MSTPAEDSVDKDDKLRADAQNKQAQIEMYLASWQDMKEQSRHFDGVRTQACAIMIAAVGVNLAFIAENGPQQVDVSAGILIAILGLLGFAMNEVYTARIVERNIQSETAWKHLKSIIGITGGIGVTYVEGSVLRIVGQSWKGKWLNPDGKKANDNTTTRLSDTEKAIQKIWRYIFIGTSIVALLGIVIAFVVPDSAKPSGS